MGLAASAYGADKSFARGKKFAPAMLKGRPPVIDLPRNGCEIVADFENGMGDVEVFTPPSIKAKMKVAVINDPTAPTPGKVLKITIPPGEYRGRSADLGYLRVSVLPESSQKTAVRTGVLRNGSEVRAGSSSSAA